MTCREKLRLEHPEFTKEDIDSYIFNCCPNDINVNIGTPHYCAGANARYCGMCWDREIPFEYPCTNCDTGWGSISSEGCKSCHDTCERLANYTRLQQRMESMTESKVIACTTCSHRAVCKNTEEFKAAQLSVANMTVSHGDGRTIRLCDISYIEPVELKCKHYRKEVTTR